MIELSGKDRKYLYKLVKAKKLNYEQDNLSHQVLIENKLAKVYFTSDKYDPDLGEHINPQNIIAPTSTGLRYKDIYREQIREKYFTPIWVSMATTVLIWLTKYLLENWL
ncbi:MULTISPECIES: hypothetical protein [Lactococcus]|uniref:hypothetical protein n=1 Tax=Lactococcus TaxID=1357 RepID=UPI0014318770|nr:MULTISPECIES: hypothetical protein [unclassified Lactococcus]KAF6607991.1 hypothetical protein HFD74_11055 [Lactococcus sp. EKM201L]KAF6611819.1 hypothetical protein HFD15_10890 [Lactococcus sp. EKM203L]KAF6640318.1 hypothetical protein HFC73_11665 [Lactococcus sp. EKM501L]KAF6642621.1 hypothetical protein HFC72_11320 [Lactococcus sp. EKM502L]KAF6650785.1 hypothetical protein HFC74_12040 [Lactococcus sp. EKM101L]